MAGEEGKVWTDALISALGTQEGVEDVDQNDNGRKRCWICNLPSVLSLKHGHKFFSAIPILNMDLP